MNFVHFSRFNCGFCIFMSVCLKSLNAHKDTSVLHFPGIVCDRCYVNVDSHFDQHFSHRLVESLEGDYNDEYIEVNDYMLDLSELVISDILLSLPSKYLCKGDCQGLCHKCGHNLNLGDCDCDKREIDPRLEALRQLLD